jgi:hypothetical protein
MRSLSSDTLAAIQAAGGEERVFLLAIEFSGGWTYLSTGSRDLSWDSKTWQAVGGALAIGMVEESDDMKGAGVDLVLSGVDQSVSYDLLTQDYRGREAKLYQAILDPTNGTVVDTILLFDGLQLDNYEIEEKVARDAPLSSTIRTHARHRLGVNEFGGIRANLHSHQQYYSGDTFFTHAPSLAGKKIYWGTSAPSFVGGGGGGGRDDMPYAK